MEAALLLCPRLPRPPRAGASPSPQGPCPHSLLAKACVPALTHKVLWLQATEVHARLLGQRDFTGTRLGSHRTACRLQTGTWKQPAAQAAPRHRKHSSPTCKEEMEPPPPPASAALLHIHTSRRAPTCIPAWVGHACRQTEGDSDRGGGADKDGERALPRQQVPTATSLPPTKFPLPPASALLGSGAHAHRSGIWAAPQSGRPLTSWLTGPGQFLEQAHVGL